MDSKIIIGIIAAIIVVVAILIIFFINKRNKNDTKKDTTDPPIILNPIVPPIVTKPEQPVVTPYIPRKYTFYQGYDTGDNIGIFSDVADKLNELQKKCDETQSCIAFSTKGAMKKSIHSRNKWNRWSEDPTKGLYVLSSITPEYDPDPDPELDFVPDPEPEIVPELDFVPEPEPEIVPEPEPEPEIVVEPTKGKSTLRASTAMICAAGQQYNAGLCYNPCPAGYTGVGPSCWPPCTGDTTDAGVACTKKLYGRTAGKSMICPADKVIDAGLCYDPCRAGYKGGGPLCYPTCSGETTDDGAVCTKKSYGRTAGKALVATCPSGYELWGGLCYKKCPTGGKRTASLTCDFGTFGGFKLNCSSSPKIQSLAMGDICPQYGSEYHKTSACTCQKKGIVSATQFGKSVVPTYVCPSGFERDGALCYPACKAGYKGVGPICWASTCPPNTKDIGATCSKITYSRGVGAPLSACAAGFERDGELCYPTCKSGYKGIGPTCWAVCPTDMTDVGVTCSKKAYNRGVGKAISSCAQGYDKIGALCYKACPTGTVADGIYCKG